MSEAKKVVQRMFASKLGKPPAADENFGNLRLTAPPGAPQRSTEKMAQVNVRLPASAKKRARLLAARDSLSLSDLFLRALDLYEQTHGRAPEQ